LSQFPARTNLSLNTVRRIVARTSANALSATHSVRTSGVLVTAMRACAPRHVDAVDADAEAGNDLEFGKPAHERNTHAFMSSRRGSGDAVGNAGHERILVGGLVVAVHRIGGVELHHGRGNSGQMSSRSGFMVWLSLSSVVSRAGVYPFPQVPGLVQRPM